MTNHTKTIIALVVLIAVIIIGWLWYGMSGNAPVPSQSINSQQSAQTDVSADVGLTTSASDASDAALQSDLNSVGSQMNGLDTDTSNIQN